MRSRITMVAGLIVSVLALALVGCTKSGHSGITAPKPSVAPGHSTAIPAPVALVAAPGLGAISTLAKVEPRSGGYSTRITVQPGKLLTLLYCLNGRISISVETIGGFSVDCSSTKIIPYGGQMDVTAAADLTVVVTPSDGNVTWSLSVGSLSVGE